MAGRPQGKHDSITEIRGGLRRAFKAMENSGKPISTIWLEMFKEDKFQAMKLAIAAQPKEQNINLFTEDTLEAIPGVDWTVLREAKAQIEHKPVNEKTH